MRPYILFIIPLIIFLLSACSTLNNVIDSSLNLVGLGPENRLRNITIESAVNSNSQNPVAIDIVFIFDKPLAQSLVNLRSPQWFQQKNAIMLQSAQKLIVISTDMVPGIPAKTVERPNSSKKAVTILFFANYLSEDGQLAAAIEGYEQVNIQLNQHQYIIQTDKK
jgi:hypothetical protein